MGGNQLCSCYASTRLISHWKKALSLLTLCKAWERINKDNGVGHYIDWATPTFYDTIVSQLQKLFAKEIDPATFTAEVEKDYSAFLAGQ